MLTNPPLGWGLIKGFGIGDIALLYRRFSVDTLRSVEGLATLVHNSREQGWLNGQTACVNHHTSMHRFGPGFTVRSNRGDSGEEEGGKLSCKRQLDGRFDRTVREVPGLNHGSVYDQRFELLPWRFRLTYSLPEQLSRVEAHLVKHAQQALTCGLGRGLHGGNPRTPDALHLWHCRD